MTKLKISWAFFVIIGACLGATAYFSWRYLQPPGLPENIIGGNGRIEAVEIDIATKTAGRIKEILADEGDFVVAGQVLARMDDATLLAQQREAQAALQQAISTVDIARSQIIQRKSERSAALAVIAQHEAKVAAARTRLTRSQNLLQEKAVSRQVFEDDRANFLTAEAMLRAAQSDLAAVEASIVTAKAQLQGAESNVDAARATLERIRVELDDGILKAPCNGRVQYRVAQPSEVLSAGGMVLNFLDLSDVYMTFFLPTELAGKLAVGSEVRLVLDAASQYVIPANISFVADVAQFTPKTVETATERQKLMFRVKARISPKLLKKHITYVKTGLPGMAYVRLDSRLEWPETLQVKLPQ